MFTKIFLISTIFVAVSAAGTLSILKYPKSLNFKGDEAINSESLGDVFAASLGYSVVHPSEWSGLFVNNPFSPAKGIVTIIVDGIDNLHLDNGKIMNYPIDGYDGEDSLDSLFARVREHHGLTADLDLNQGFTNRIFGHLDTKTDKTTTSLKPQTNAEDKLFLEQIAAINDLASKFADVKTLPTLTEIHVSIAPLVQVHSLPSPAISDALKLLSTAVEQLATSAQNAYDDDAVVAVITNNEQRIRRKRATQDVDPTTLNLAESYSEDYPVIFNIILWFGVVMAFTLLSVAYVIGYMDPGRDSIIYRMTSTRMKKDN